MTPYNIEMPTVGNGNINFGELSEMVGVELRIAKILADRLFASSQNSELASGQYTVLSLVKLNPGLNQSSLARCMFLDRSSMVPILDQFEGKGWIERRPHASDRRSHAIHLTKEGGRVLSKVDRKVHQLERRIASAMGQDKRDQLLTLTKDLQSALRAVQQLQEN